MSATPKTPRQKYPAFPKKQRLNETALLWEDKSLPDAERAALRNEVFLLSFELFDWDPTDPAQRDTIRKFLGKGKRQCSSDFYVNNYPDAFMSAFEATLTTFDSSKGVFSDYLEKQIRWKLDDAYRKRMVHAPNAGSLDVPISEDNTLTLGEVVADEKAVDPGQLTPLSGALADLTAQILNFSERHAGKAGNETRRSWFRIFYTEDMTQVAKETKPFLLHERDVFSAMDLTYLDYYMSQACRQIQKIAVTPLKPYHMVVPASDSLDETPVPLPADVSIAYWEAFKGVKVGRSARSNQHSIYEAEKEQICLC